MSAKNYTKTFLHESLQLTDEQDTIPRRVAEDYSSLLNAKGLQLWREVNQKVLEGNYKATFGKYTLLPSQSGAYFPPGWTFRNDPSVEIPEEKVASLHTWNDLKIVTFDSNTKKFMESSPIIFYTNTWAYTRSGSLYRLGELGDLQSLIAQEGYNALAN